VNREADQQGVCGVGREAIVSTVGPHYGEETVLQGWGGSGTIFFGMCNMRCVFCQNWDISQRVNGTKMDTAALADAMLSLQAAGCHNINLVTPEHVVPQIVKALARAVSEGLSLPIVYNTSAYDSLESLAMLDGLVDIYLPDFKFFSSATAQLLAKAADYPATAQAAIKAMHRQVGDLCFSEDGLAQRGLLVRHLMMPGLLAESREILKWIAQELSTDTFVHIMSQYQPDYLVRQGGEFRSRQGRVDYAFLNRTIPPDEHLELLTYAREQGLWRFEETAEWDR
jgi:putative pyruvate formate lyase activating enzyme